MTLLFTYLSIASRDFRGIILESLLLSSIFIFYPRVLEISFGKNADRNDGLNVGKETIVQNILTYLGLAKYVIPVFDALVAQLEADIPVEKSDLAQAVADFKKAFGDTKTAIEALVTAIKAAIANA